MTFAARGRCFRGGKCVLTMEHTPTAECAARNNEAGKKLFSFTRRRPGQGGEGAAERRAERRNTAHTVSEPAQGARDASLALQTASHERQGNMRNGQHKRRAEGEAERGDGMVVEVGGDAEL